MADTVKIGCRVPAGLRLRAYDWFKGPDGEQQLREVGMFDLAGSGNHLGTGGGGMEAEADAAYTEVDSDLWDKWLALNEGSDLVTSGAVFKGRSNAKVADTGVADPAQAEADRQTAAREAAAKADGGKSADAPAPPAGGKDDAPGTKDTVKPAKAS